MFKIPDNVSKFDNVYDVLKERGFIEQTTDDEGIRELLGRSTATLRSSLSAAAPPCWEIRRDAPTRAA